jgi:hypothetical protein
VEKRSLKSESKHDQRIQEFPRHRSGGVCRFCCFRATYAKEQTFVAVIKNVTTDKTLQLPDGKMTKAPIAPGVYAVVRNGFTLFDPGKQAGKGGLEALAEDGNAEMLIGALKGLKDVRDAGMFIPGQSFEVSAEPGDRLVFASTP